MSATFATAWILLSSALLLLLIFGLGMHHAGLARARHSLAMVMHTFGAIMTVSVTWVLVGFSLAYSDDAWAGLVGNLSHAGLTSLASVSLSFDAAPIASAIATMMIATLAAVVVTGAGADRMKFGALISFLGLWSVFVYPVVTHWIMSDAGWLSRWGALDFAGGSAIHIAGGASAMGLAYALGPRRGWPTHAMRPHNALLSLTGTAFMWLGFLALSAMAAGTVESAAAGAAASAVLATHISGVGGMAGWVLLDKRITGKVSAVGAAFGALAGLAAATVAAGFLDPFAALLVGFVAGAGAYLALGIKKLGRFDDATDAVAIHLTGGVVGMIAIGLMGRMVTETGTTAIGALNAGGWALLGKQAVAALAIAVVSFALSWVLAMIVRGAMGLRVTPEGEERGLDEDQHGEFGYDIRR